MKLSLFSKILITLLIFPMYYINLIIIIIAWDGKYMIVFDLMDKIWIKETKEV